VVLLTDLPTLAASGHDRSTSPLDAAMKGCVGSNGALEHLPERWQEAVRAAGRVYDGEAWARGEEVLGETMAPFVAMVCQHLPLVDPGGGGTAQKEWLLNETE
jgi:hypothetical protein